jgi:ribulose 1,5-bisphosphate synthetase/thiazole synthase
VSPHRLLQILYSMELPLTSVYSSVDVLVIGAGPTGLGAAKRLNQIVCLPKDHERRG